MWEVQQLFKDSLDITQRLSVNLVYFKENGRCDFPMIGFVEETDYNYSFVGRDSVLLSNFKFDTFSGAYKVEVLNKSNSNRLIKLSKSENNYMILFELKIGEMF